MSFNMYYYNELWSSRVVVFSSLFFSTGIIAFVSSDIMVREAPSHQSIERDLFPSDSNDRFLLALTIGNMNTTLTLEGEIVWWRPVIPVHPRDHDPRGLEQRGIYVLVLHPCTGELLNEAFFSGWMSMDTGHSFRRLIEDTQTKHLLVFFTLGEVGPGVKQIPEVTAIMRKMGARHYDNLSIGDRHVLIKRKDGAVFSEAFVSNAEMEMIGVQGQSALQVSATVPILKYEELQCSWSSSLDNQLRANFCRKYGGYGILCDCRVSKLLPLESVPLEKNNLTDVPISIVASNRPRALWRSMRTLLTNPGISISQVVVFVDGEYQEVEDLCELLKIKHVPTANDETDVTLRIREHYRRIMTDVWYHYPNASKTIFLEEDLEVSPDFISYFSQTAYLLDKDDSLWCISAWNDNGYDVSSSDPSLLYRVEYMPGLGWMMRRADIKKLLAKWPRKGQAYDWDLWIRWSSNRLGRECVIPDVSRTYHFGISGRHLSGTFHTMYFVDHAVNKIPNVKLREVEKLIKEPYEEHLKEMMREAKPLHPSDFQIEGDLNDAGECRVNLTAGNSIYTVFFHMKNWEDDDLYRALAKCFLIWDLDARDQHHGLWRFTYYDNHILMFGVPLTKYMNEAMLYLKHPIEVINELK